MSEDKRREYHRKYRETHREQIKANNRKYRETHREQINAKQRMIEDQRREYNRKYRETHREQLKANKRVYLDSHREQTNATHRKYIKTHKEQYEAYHRKYRETHREQLKVNMRKYRASQKANKPQTIQKAKDIKPQKKDVKHRPRIDYEYILKTYYDNKDASWEELASKLGYSIKTTKQRVGFALMEECRELEDCALKPLLPENIRNKDEGKEE